MIATHPKVTLLHLVMLGGLVACLASCRSTVPSPRDGSTVRVRGELGNYELTFDGEPYYIYGAGARTNLDQLVEAGGNSIRTWGIKALPRMLDEAHRRGLTVTAGIWLGHERHGFNYSNELAVEAQLNKARRAVQKYKDHPALLMWAVGNEMEWFPGTNVLVYKAVNDIAKMIKEEDPYHPTITVIAELGEEGIKVKNVAQHCPDIDILGINAYGGMPTVPERLEEAGWTKPYIITEFGEKGEWSAAKTDWGAELERYSHTKGEFYRECYEQGVASQPGWCLGSYVFIWGEKRQCTLTWNGMFLDDGAPLSAVDSMIYCWTGNWPSNRCPYISMIRSPLKGKYVEASTEYDVHVKAFDPDGDEVRLEMELYSEIPRKGHGGDKEPMPKHHPDAVVKQEGSTFTIRTPSMKGAYRLYVYAYDEHGKAATANTPFYVQ